MKQPTKEQVLKASEKCPDTKGVLEDLYPDAFKEEWVDITGEITWKIYRFIGGECWLMGTYEELKCSDGQFYFNRTGFHFNNVQAEKDFKLEEGNDQGFRILKKK